MAPRKQTQNVAAAPTAAPATLTAPAAIATPVQMSEADRYAMLSQKPYGALSRDERKFMDDYSRKQDKAQDGAYAHIGFAENDPTLLQMDVKVINVGPNTKRTADGRPYLWSLDGFEFVAFGTTWSVGSFFAVQKKAK